VLALPFTLLVIGMSFMRGGMTIGMGALGALWFLYSYVYLATGLCDNAERAKHLVFNDERLGNRWSGRKIPMDILIEAYIEGKIEFKKNTGSDHSLLHRDLYVSYRPTMTTVRFLLAQFVPGLSSSLYDKKTVQRENALAYSKGNDFFAAFLGPSMIYTSGIFESHDETLEQAQERKMDEICQRLRLKPGARLLDIGCGWGALARHAERKYGAVVTAVTLSEEGAKWCREKNAELGTSVEILHMDYRDIPRDRKFDAVSAIEFMEHVAMGNMPSFMAQLQNHLTDEGMLVIQVTGLRQGANWADLSWGVMLMAKYVFPGADNSTPVWSYVRNFECDGFQIQNVSNLRYSTTLARWRDNFAKNEVKVREAGYPESLIRLWRLFLAWSTIAAAEGSAACHMYTMHKNLSSFDRDVFMQKHRH